MDLLRFATAGSVDDGKSTLIGRLLYDTKSIPDDQFAAVESAGKRRGEKELNLALFTDGLRAEREQGITIDVAYRYFSTAKRKFILSDCPGHVQYTRNLVTAISGVNLVVLMVDARTGITEQTRRHTFLAGLFGIKHLLVCINKMDLVGYEQAVFEKQCDDFSSFLSKISIPDIQFIPISALKGDNVADKTAAMPWYQGATLLHLLENTKVTNDNNFVDCRFPVQLVLRGPEGQGRYYAGRVAGGVFKPGDEVMALPSGFTTRIKSIQTADGELDSAFPPLSVTLTTTDEIDLGRGDMLVKPNNKPRLTQDLDVMICCLNGNPLRAGDRYIIKHTTLEARCIVKEVLYKIDINTLHRVENDKILGLNDIGRIRLRSTRPLPVDSYTENKITGSFILINEADNNTVAACMIRATGSE